MKSFIISPWAIVFCTMVFTLTQKAFSSEIYPVRIFKDFKVDYDYDIRSVEAVRKISHDEIDFMACNVLVGNVPICSTQDSINIYTIVFTYSGDAIVISNRLD